jgi:hypothetical protein
MKDIRGLHGEIFGERSAQIQDRSCASPSRRINDDLPPLVSRSHGRGSSSVSQQPHAALPSLVCKPDGLDVAEFEHHCQFSFMRSQLSRILANSNIDPDGVVLRR